MATSKTNLTTARILAFLLEQGCFAWRQNVTGVPVRNGGFRPASKVGVPDILAVIPPAGKFLGIEIKTGKDRPRPEQLGFQSSLHHVGAHMIFVKDFEDFYEQYQAYFKK